MALASLRSGRYCAAKDGLNAPILRGTECYKSVKIRRKEFGKASNPPPNRSP